jgi:hypothetical protein
MNSCFICLEDDNVIKICNCNIYVHIECGNELGKFKKACNICGYIYKFNLVLLNKPKIFLIYVKNIIDAIIAIFIGYFYIHILNNINSNIFVNIIIQFHVIQLFFTYSTLIIYFLIWKYFKTMDLFSPIIQKMIPENYQIYIQLYNRGFIQFRDLLIKELDRYYQYNYTTAIAIVIVMKIEKLIKFLINIYLFKKEIFEILKSIIKNDITERHIYIIQKIE